MIHGRVETPWTVSISLANLAVVTFWRLPRLKHWVFCPSASMRPFQRHCYFPKHRVKAGLKCLHLENPPSSFTLSFSFEQSTLLRSLLGQENSFNLTNHDYLLDTQKGKYLSFVSNEQTAKKQELFIFPLENLFLYP